MTIYKHVILAESENGEPITAQAPIGCSVHPGDLVSTDGTLSTVQVATLMDPESEEYAILSAVCVIHEADAVYRQSWHKEEPDDADDP